ncbi:hypothetical protein DPEC_G00302470 [Dallia pectoralis]|uniref:Uncharacterized protein n=1 Tax=Dallia pectoralis TaxID=75939 RepID=A0ACC2FGR5_DALPE|nr:hypothetical protein DPEC_G00302470 [Dallia pectoralis]
MQQVPLTFGVPWELYNYPHCLIFKSRHSPVTLHFCNFIPWVLLGVLTFPCCVQCLIFKVGVLGPWNCDPVYSKAFPEVAAKLAVGRINEDFSLDLGCKLEFVILQEACQTSKALTTFVYYEKTVDAFIGPANPGYCDAASLLAKNWDKAVFSWACINYELDQIKGYPTFARTLPSPTRVLFMVLKHFRWANIGIVSSNEDIWMDTAGKVANSLRSQGLPVGIVASVGINETEMESTLRQIQAAGEIKGKSILYNTV